MVNTVNNFFFPLPSIPKADPELSNEVLLRIYRNKVKALNLRISKAEQDSTINVEVLMASKEETMNKIEEIEQELMSRDEQITAVDNADTGAPLKKAKCNSTS